MVTLGAYERSIAAGKLTMSACFLSFKNNYSDSINVFIDKFSQYEVFDSEVYPVQPVKAYADKSKNDELKKAQAENKVLKTKLEQQLKQQKESFQLHKQHDPQQPSVDEKIRFILSAFWLGVSFFLQRLLEKFFQDKGYALLIVCATGFLVAFLTTSYFLVGSSFTGGLFGSMRDRT